MNVIEYKSYMFQNCVKTLNQQLMIMQKCYKGSFNVRISPELHHSLVIFATSHNMTLNATIEQALQKFVSNH